MNAHRSLLSHAAETAWHRMEGIRIGGLLGRALGVVWKEEPGKGISG